MAGWRNKSTVLQIDGFEEVFKAIENAGKEAQVEGRKCFETCAETMYDELYKKASQAGLDNRLIEQIDERFIEDFGVWFYEVGWKKQRPTKNGKLPDTYKVMFYNYGTPNGNRTTKAGYNRGQEPAHPEGSHGFIKKAKLAARNKIKKIQRSTLKEILKGLK